jgi:hypothetical protein
MTKRQEYMIIIEVCRKFHKQVYFVYNRLIKLLTSVNLLYYYIMLLFIT